MGKKAFKRKRENEVENSENKAEMEKVPPAKRLAEEPLPTKMKWINKQRVLVLAARGINHRDRHLMEDLKKLMPHHKPESKMERSKTLTVINEMCEMKNCNKAILFEGRKKQDLYAWFSNVPNGPSAKFLIENIHTMAELKMTGNCLRGSRPLLSFDPSFNEKPQYALLKELFTQIFGVPKQHPKSQPFFDHIYTFTILDNRVWFRNFQILSEDGALAEIGPRFVLNPVKIFSESFGGLPLWTNPNYVSPAKYRQQIRKKSNYKYINRVEQKAHAIATKPKESYKLKPLDDIFSGNPIEKAKLLEAQKEEQAEANEEPKTQEEEETSENSKTKEKIKKPKAKLNKVVKKKKIGKKNKQKK